METKSSNEVSTQAEYKAEKRNAERNLFVIKKARRQIESDSQMLANRIALLKQEELKAIKKIEDTKQKALEVYHLKKNHEDKLNEKLLKQQNDNTNLQQNQHSNLDLRKKKQLEINMIREALHSYKHEEMLKVKKQQEINENKKEQFLSSVRNENNEKFKAVKEQHSYSALKRKSFFDNKMYLFQEESGRNSERRSDIEI